MMAHHCWNSIIVLLVEVLLNHHKRSLVSHYPIFLLPMRLQVIEDFLLNLMRLVLAAIRNLFVDNGCQRNGPICLIRNLMREVDVIHTWVEVQAGELLCAHLVFQICESVVAPLVVMRVLGVVIVHTVLLIIVHKRLVLFELDDLGVAQALYIKLEVAWLTANALL